MRNLTLSIVYHGISVKDDLLPMANDWTMMWCIYWLGIARMGIEYILEQTAIAPTTTMKQVCNWSSLHPKICKLSLGSR